MSKNKYDGKHLFLNIIVFPFKLIYMFSVFIVDMTISILADKKEFHSLDRNKKQSKRTDSNTRFNHLVFINNDIKKVDDLTGIEFEHFVGRILKDNGYTDIKVLQASGDYGVDVLAKKDGVIFAIQCKCYSTKVSISAIQEILGGKEYYKANVAAVITNNRFTEPAKKLAHSTGVVLWDRDDLKTMMQKVKV